MDPLIQKASEFGLMGLVLLASFWYINKKDSEYQEERNLHRDNLEAMHQSALKAINNNTSALAELKTIINNK